MAQDQIEIQTADRLTLRGIDWQPEGEALATVCLVRGIGEHVGVRRAGRRRLHVEDLGRPVP